MTNTSTKQVSGQLASPDQPSLSHSAGKSSTGMPPSGQFQSLGGARAFTAVRLDGKHTLSSDDESDTTSRVLKSHMSKRQRRRTLSVVTARPLSPQLGASDSDVASDSGVDKFLSARRIPLRRRRSTVPESDKVARQRCFDYLLSGIDAVWAEYCDSTSHAEFRLYMPCSPISEGEQEEADDVTVSSPGEPASEQPHSQRLMRLKRRLLDSKYYMSDLTSTSDPDGSSQFWKRWDAIKHAVVELVEGDDEDSEAVVDELEDGRLF